jgi:transcriptional regulator with XRE-family HTH domain
MKAIDIRKRRKELNLSQAELGKLIGVHGNTIYNYENGAIIPDTSYKMLAKVLFDLEGEDDDKSTRVDSLKKEIYEATNNLINVLNEQIKEAQKDTSTINSIEKIQSLLRIKLELITELQQSIK